MEIVIDIPDDVYNNIKSNEEIITYITKNGGGSNALHGSLAIINGTILPKGHGVLKDVTNLMRGLYTDMQTIEETFTSSDVYNMIDKECPTIIEADDKESD